MYRESPRPQADTIARRRAAFTLVELLVVIGIIGMLVALLLPAVMSSQAQAHQVQCAKQMKDLAAAHLMHAMKKGRFAGWRDTWSTGNGPVDVGWVPQIMPYLDMQQHYRDVRKNGFTPENDDPIPILICPSNPPESVTSTVMGYAVNTGRADATDNTGEKITPINEITPERRWTALFHDRTASSKVSVGLDDVLDGKRQTLLLSEGTTVVGKWNSNTPSETGQGIQFGEFGDTSQSLGDVDVDSGASVVLPNSFHQEGFNVAYVDGHTEFFFVDGTVTEENSDNHPYNIYRNLMTPAGAYNGIVYPPPSGN